MLALASLLALAAAGCGGSGGTGQLRWDGEPTVVSPPSLPNDLIVSGMVRNDSLRELRLTASKVKLLDKNGHEIHGITVFLNAYLHGLYPPTRGPFPRPAGEQERTGLTARVKPGKTLPFTVAWRLPKRADVPVRIDYGVGWCRCRWTSHLRA